MKNSPLIRQNGALFLLAVLVIAGLIVFVIQNQPRAVVSNASKSEFISLPTTLTSMDVGTNAPWLGDVQIPVTGSQGNPMDAGAGAPGLSGQNQPANDSLNRGDRDVHFTPVPTSSGLLSGGGR